MRYSIFFFVTLILSCSTPQKKEESTESPKNIQAPIKATEEISDTNDTQTQNEKIVEEEEFTSNPIVNIERTQTKNPNPMPLEWQALDSGLFYTEADAQFVCNLGDSKICILKIDPKQYQLKLFSAKAEKSNNLTADQWAKNKGLFACVNAGMFSLQDHKTNMGYMRDGKNVNNPNITNDRSFIAFNPKDSTLPAFQIIDKSCNDWQNLIKKYDTVIQGIRMMDCNGNIKWSQQPKYWSTVCIGEDQNSHAYFIFSRSPFSVHDLLVSLKKLPITFQNITYLEGGPEASFFLNHPKKAFKKMGSYETGFNENDNNKEFWPLPNLIGVVKR